MQDVSAGRREVVFNVFKIITGPEMYTDIEAMKVSMKLIKLSAQKT